MAKVYDKYDKDGDIHWQWAKDNRYGYRDLVNDAIEPFKNAALGTVVDLGCGDGFPTAMLNALGLICTGVDSSAIGVEIAKGKPTTQCNFFNMPVEEFAEYNLAFDYVFCFDAIEHFDDPNAVVKIMHNVREFGIVVTNVAKGDKSPYHEKEYTPETLRELLKDFHCEPLAIRDPDYFGFKISRRA